MLLESGEDVDQRDQVLVLSSLCKLNVQQVLLPWLRSWILEFLSCPGCDRLTFSEGFRAIIFEPMKRGTTRACTNAFEYYMHCVRKQHFDWSVMTGSIIVTDNRRGPSQNILFWFSSWKTKFERLYLWKSCICWQFQHIPIMFHSLYIFKTSSNTVLLEGTQLKWGTTSCDSKMEPSIVSIFHFAVPSALAVSPVSVQSNEKTSGNLVFFVLRCAIIQHASHF